jgi:signal transduction histidine kinase/FixJ family two-component response regulator
MFQTVSRRHILYIEDNLALAHLMQKRLVRLGHRVDIAVTGAEGLSKLQDGNYDLIAIDQHLPDRKGIALLSELQQFEHTPPIIMVTGHGDESLAVEAMKLGASDYLVKDVAGKYLDIFPSVLEQVLERDQLKREKKEALLALEQRNCHLTELNRIGQLLTSTRNIDDIFTGFLSEVTQLVNASGSSVWLWDSQQETRLICYRAYLNGQELRVKDLHLKPNQGFAGWVVSNKLSVNVENAGNDPRFFPQIDKKIGFHTQTLLAVPLRVRNRIIGVLEVVNKKGAESTFTPNDLSLVETLATFGAIAIDNAGLITALQQHTLDLAARNDELDAFAHTVAHDLKSPVSTLIGFTDMLMRDYEEFTPSDRDLIHTNLAHLGRKMNNIIDELLLLASLRKEEIKTSPIHMGDIVREAKRRLAFSITEKMPTINQPNHWPFVLGYGAWIEEVWANYISNAIKYGGTPPILELGYTELENNMVKFWVRDNGDGIPESERKELFKPFTTLKSVHIKGHGLGLSITRRIVEKLGGEVAVESIIGEGSIFSFTLPRLDLDK